MDRLRLAALVGQLDESRLRTVNGELSLADVRTQTMPLAQAGVAGADASGAVRQRR
jgi:hypothetical protein